MLEAVEVQRGRGGGEPDEHDHGGEAGRDVMPGARHHDADEEVAAGDVGRAEDQ